MFQLLQRPGKLIPFALPVLLLLAAFQGAAFAQTETGQISGKVTDPTGAVVTGASVTVKSPTTGATRSVTTSGEGLYNVTNLQPGIYDVTVKAQGFADRTTQVEVTVGSKVSVDVALAVTAISAGVVDVIASGGVEVNTQHQELSDVVSGKQITELPTLTRSPYALVALSGNIAGDPNGSTGANGVGYSINGQRSASTNILLDGADNNNTFSANVGQSVPLDSVQEFRVVTSNFSAEYGRASGGIVNVATKAGTNSFHGTAFDFNRVAALASNSFDDNAQGNPRGGFTRNQFGYSLGGPVIKDKLLFFNSTEWIRVRSSANAINVVPTPQLLGASNAATQTFFNAYKLARPINGTIFTVGDVIASVGASNFSATNAFSALPANTPAFGQTKFSLPADQGAGSPQNSYQTVARVDWNLSDKTQIYGRYALESQVFFDGSLNYSPYEGFDTGQTAFNNNILLSLTRTFSSNLVSQTKVTFNRLNLLQPLGKQPVSPTLYLTGGTARIRVPSRSKVQAW